MVHIVNKIALIGISLFAFLLFVDMARAMGPTTHMYLVDRFFLEDDSEIAKLCKNYRKEFEAGALLPDITVKFYYTENARKYKVTHNWNFQQRCLDFATDDSQKCFCYGIGIGHYAPDVVSHNVWIPSEIPIWQVPNSGIHPTLEAVLEAHIIKTYPQVYKRTARGLDILLPENSNYREDLVKLTKKSVSAIDPQELIEVEEEIRWLSGWLGSFYTNVYFAPQIYSGISSIVDATGSGEGYMKYVRMSQEKMHEFATNWATFSRQDNEPHGFTKLFMADKAVTSTAWGLIKMPTKEDITSGGGILFLNVIRYGILIILFLIVVFIIMFFVL